MIVVPSPRGSKVQTRCRGIRQIMTASVAVVVAVVVVGTVTTIMDRRSRRILLGDVGRRICQGCGRGPGCACACTCGRRRRRIRSRSRSRSRSRTRTRRLDIRRYAHDRARCGGRWCLLLAVNDDDDVQLCSLFLAATVISSIMFCVTMSMCVLNQNCLG